MKRTAIAGFCAALALTGVVAPSASAGKPVPVDPTATIQSATVGPVWKLPSFPVEQWGCDVVVTATLSGITSKRYYALFMADIDGFGSGWSEMGQTNPIRLTRGQTEVTYTAHPGGATDQIGDYRAFRVDVVTRHRGRYWTWDVVSSSPEFTVNWDATTCVAP